MDLRVSSNALVTAVPVRFNRSSICSWVRIPLETSWHRTEINLLIDSLRHHWRDHTDYYTGGNMFIYFSFEQARTRPYRGPDFFVVLGVDGSYARDSWIVWEEGGRYPNVIVELLSPSTARIDKTLKKELYEETFRTPDYFCYDPGQQELLGWRLRGHRYEPLTPDERGWLWSEELQLWLGTWEGEVSREWDVWLRFYDSEGRLVLLPAEAEHQRAEAERQRAEAAEAELARLRARLAALQAD